MAKLNEDFPHDLYRFLPEKVRNADEKQNKLLERFLGGPQEVWERTADRILELDTLHDVDRIDDKWLTYLKWHVGWTSELDYITEDLSNDELRKLIRLSAAFWKRKGTERGIKDAIRVLTGRDVIIRNWFNNRWVVGVSGLWRLGQETDPYVVGSTYGEQDEYLSTVYVNNEVGIERELIRELINLNRPLQENYVVAYPDLVDDFRLGRGKWLTITGDEPVWDDERYKLVVSPGTVVRANVPSLETAEEVVWRHRCAFSSSSGGAVQMEFRRQAALPNNRYRATWYQDGTVTLEVVISGIATTLATAQVGHILPQDETSFIGITLVRDCDAALRIAVVVYDAELIDIVVEEPQVLAPGQWQFSNLAPGDVEIDDVIAYGMPLVIDVVEPSGFTVGAPPALTAGPCVIAEADITAFVLTGLWHLSGHRYLTPAQSLYYGTGETGYFTWGTSGSLGAGITAGTATSDPIDLTDYPASDYDLELRFWSYSEIRQDPGVDEATVEILVGGIVVQTITKASIVGSGTGVAVDEGYQVHDITAAAAGNTIQVRFRFDSVDAPTAGADGWFVDQVRILAKEA